MIGFREKILWKALKRRVSVDKPYVIAIGGGIAKTSTKVALGEVLKKSFPGEVLVGYGNLNTYIGVPLAALGFKVDFYKQKFGVFKWTLVLIRAFLKGYFYKLPKYLVLEYGTDGPGDIAALTKELRPDMAIITIVAEAHVENYEDMEDVAKDESALVAALDNKGVAILNENDPYIDFHKKNLKTKDVVLVKTKLELIAKNFALAAANKLGVTKENAEEILSVPIKSEGRFEIKKLKKYYLIDDSYNANPASMEAAINVLAKSPGKKIAILGTMLELGDNSPELHRKVGEMAKDVADKIIGVGEYTKEYGPVKIFENSEQAADGIFPYLEENASILIKGSRGVRMEKIVKKIEERDGN